MTISSNLSTVTRNGNGVATSFSFPFKVWDTSQLGVYITDPDGATTTTSNFTATLSGSGGNVVYPAAGGVVLPTGWTITIIRSMPFTQNVDLVNGQAFYPDVIEQALDQLTATCQQLDEGLSRSVKVEPGQSGPTTLLTQIQTAVTTSSSNATAAAGSATDADASKTAAQQAVLDAQAAANNINTRKYPQSGYVYATPGQTVITPNFSLDTVKDNVAIYLDGIKQGRGGYTFTATDITLSKALVGGETIEVISANADAGAVTATYTELPVGTPFPHFAASGYVPAGCVPMDGAEYTRAQFPVLYDTYLNAGKLQTCTYAVWAAKVGLTGNCAMFALDTANQKFKVPMVKDGDFFGAAASTAEIGKSVKAGLPNITGETGFDTASGLLRSTANPTGAFIKGSSVGTNLGGNTGSSNMLGFSAAASNPIYGNSTTVTPEHMRVRWFVVMANAQNNTSVFDWSAYAAGLAGKLNADSSNADLSKCNVVLQQQRYQTKNPASGSTMVPFDGTVPQSTEGDQYMSLAFTPKSATSKLVIDIIFCFGTSTSGRVAISLFKDSDANALSTIGQYSAGAGYAMSAFLRHVLDSPGISAITFKARAGLDQSGTLYFNGGSSYTSLYGGCESSIVITEYAA